MQFAGRGAGPLCGVLDFLTGRCRDEARSREAARFGNGVNGFKQPSVEGDALQGQAQGHRPSIRVLNRFFRTHARLFADASRAKIATLSGFDVDGVRMAITPSCGEASLPAYVTSI